MRVISYSFTYFIILAATCSSGKPSHEATGGNEVHEARPLSVRMADSDMKRNPEGWMVDFNDKPKWDYTQGLFASALKPDFPPTSGAAVWTGLRWHW